VSGTFPLVLFSHGYAGFRDQSTYLTTHLASWGFVVAAPDQQSRVLTTVLGGPTVTTDPNADVAELLATIKLFTDGRGGIAQGITDPTHVIAFGHSAGGSTVERLASYLTAEQGSASVLKGFIGLAGSDFGSLSTLTAPYNTVPSMPGVFVGGSNDQVVAPSTLQDAYSELTGPRRYIELTGAGHLVFSDLCQIDPGQGGLTVLAKALGITLTGNLSLLATDGCFPPDIPVTTDWPLVDQIVVASARHMLGFDTTNAGVADLATADPTLITADTDSPLP
jgi:predicted dienelactone hydrolase